MKSAANLAASESVFTFPPGNADLMHKASRFRQLLTSSETSFIMEAHNGLSAKIVEETGFEGVWASGLSISASLGIRDSNEASWTQVLEIVEFMCDATSIPMMVDADTGYGNFNNFRRFVRKLGQRDIAAVCIEDKLFPKTNSFAGENQPLADIDEFCGKIKAGKDAQLDDDFSIIARTEALIAGWSLGEALRRAEAYRQAGADAILIHSKKSTASEILAFAKEWASRCPIVIVPTKYYATPTDHFRDAGINLVIWANHNLRAAISAMRETCRQICENENLFWAEENIAQLGDVFAISGDDELRAAEKTYLARETETKGLILVPSHKQKTYDICAESSGLLADVRGKPVLQHLLDAFRDGGLSDIAMVTADAAQLSGLTGSRIVQLPEGHCGGEVAALACATESLAGDCIVSCCDVLFRGHVLTQLRDCAADIVIVVDASRPKKGKGATRRARNVVSCSRPYTGDYFDDETAKLIRLRNVTRSDEVDGVWIGLAKFSDKGVELLRSEIAQMKIDGSIRNADMGDLFNRLVDRGAAPRVIYISGNSLDVNEALDRAGPDAARPRRVARRFRPFVKEAASAEAGV